MYNIDENSNDIWEYDSALNIWAAMADYPDTAKSSGAGFVLQNIAYTPTGRIAAFDFTSHLWELDNGIIDSIPVDTSGDTTTYTENLFSAGHIQFYANPTNGFINVVTSQSFTNGLIQVNDMSGQVFTIVNISKPSVKSLDLTDMKAGLYILNFNSNVFNFSQRIILIN